MIVPLEKPGSPQELVHFGIKGMRWGVRKQSETSNGSSTKPNDLIFKDRRAKRRERRARGHEAVARKELAAAAKIRANPSKFPPVQFYRNRQIKEHEKEAALRLKDAADIRAGKFTTFQKKVIAGAAVTAVILASYGTFKFVDSGTYHQFKNRNIPLKKNDLLSRKMSPDRLMKEVVEPINPDFGIKSGAMMNCRRATFAYELRRRGHDVEATKSILGTGQTVTGMMNATDPKASYKTGGFSILGNMLKENFTKDKPVTYATKTLGGMGREPIGKWDKFGTEGSEKVKTIFEALREHPEGARGELAMKWNSGGAHSMAWEIINGTPHIFDTQTSINYGPDDFVGMARNIGEVGMTRLDNIPLNDSYLKRWVTNAR